ncbi:MAG: hypothetical protein ACTSU3_03880 [Candidatus Thorarchaeota archaeon]
MRGLGKWASAIARSKRPKTRGKKSRKKSLLSSKSDVSHSRESAAVHSAQLSLLDFGDEVGVSDDDPAVERTIENPTDVGIDNPTLCKGKKARSAGEIVSR